eukprot:183418_1
MYSRKRKTSLHAVNSDVLVDVLNVPKGRSYKYIAIGCCILFIFVLYQICNQLLNESGFSYVATQCFFKSYGSLDEYYKSGDVFSNITDMVKTSISKKYSWIGSFPTDKFGKHNYTDYYDILFKPYLDKNRNENYPINILEIGVKKGGSLKLWRELFSSSSYVYGIDVDPGIPTFVKDAHIKTVVINSGDEIEVDKTFGEGIKFDIVIDDGCHRVQCIRDTYRILAKYLKYDGIYIIEDYPHYGLQFLSGLRSLARAYKYRRVTIHADKYEKNFVAILYPQNSLAPDIDIGIVETLIDKMTDKQKQYP